MITRQFERDHMGKIDSIRRIYRNRGPEAVVHAIVRVFCSEMHETVHSVFQRMYDLKGGKQTFTIAGLSASFDARSENGGDTVRAQFDAEYELLKRFISNIRKDDIVFDIGANIGLYSVFAGQLCDEVHAFEPAPQNFRQLVRATNQSHTATSITCHEIALSNLNGKATFTDSSEVGHGKGSLGGGAIEVQTACGDTLVDSGAVPAPDVVKIDVEGAEGLVLEGMADTLQDCRRLYCEVHLPASHRDSVEDWGWTPAQVLTTISDMGFELEILGNRGPELQVVGS